MLKFRKYLAGCQCLLNRDNWEFLHIHFRSYTTFKLTMSRSQPVSRRSSFDRLINLGRNTPTSNEEAGEGSSRGVLIPEPAGALSSEQHMHLNFIKGDPMGKLILQLVKDCEDMRTKIGQDSSHVDLNEFCTAFFTKAQVDKVELADKFKTSENTVQAKLIKNKLSSHDANLNFPPPSFYSREDTLRTAGAQSQSQKLFPDGSGKFGGKKDNDLGIIEFLSSMTRAQNIAKLSRSEFEAQMLHSTTGRAHSLLVDWFGNGESIEDVYFNLVLSFDHRSTIEEARTKLANYKAMKNSNLAKVQTDIMSLASRASTSLPPGPSRQATYNMEANLALIRALPPASSATASNTFHSISSDLARASTFTELCKAVNVYRHTIDADIKMYGMAQKEKTHTTATQGTKKQWGSKKYKGATSYAISGTPQGATSSGQGPIQSTSYGKNQTQKGWNKGGNNSNGYQGQNKSYNEPGHHQQGGHGQGNGQKSGYKGKSGKGSWKGNGSKNRGHNDPHYCSLCGNCDHKAVDGCPFMVDDNGARVKFNPVQGVCGACPPSINPRLHHNERLCPFRKNGGPLHGTAF